MCQGETSSPSLPNRLANGICYNAGKAGLQLSVNLISRLEEEGPTRLYACHQQIRTPDQACRKLRLSQLGHSGGQEIEGFNAGSHGNFAGLSDHVSIIFVTYHKLESTRCAGTV